LTQSIYPFFDNGGEGTHLHTDL